MFKRKQWKMKPCLTAGSHRAIHIHSVLCLLSGSNLFSRDNSTKACVAPGGGTETVSQPGKSRRMCEKLGPLLSWLFFGKAA